MLYTEILKYTSRINSERVFYQFPSFTYFLVFIDVVVVIIIVIIIRSSSSSLPLLRLNLFGL